MNKLQQKAYNMGNAARSLTRERFAVGSDLDILTAVFEHDEIYENDLNSFWLDGFYSRDEL